MNVRPTSPPSRVASARSHRRFAVLLSALLAAWFVAMPAEAQVKDGEACKPGRVAPEKMVAFDKAYPAAEQRAKAWAPDAQLARFTHTSLGPIDADARSANWYSTWYSKAADAWVSITIADGAATCWAMPGSAGRMPQLKPDWYKDAKRVLAIAAENGGAALMKDGYLPEMELSAGSGGVAYWFVNYDHPTKRHGLQVIVDANTGKFRSALK
jgi:hypothetical protein